jgi:hypothetical protein
MRFFSLIRTAVLLTCLVQGLLLPATAWAQEPNSNASTPTEAASPTDTGAVNGSSADTNEGSTIDRDCLELEGGNRGNMRNNSVGFNLFGLGSSN